jgi:hypothetical protein
MRLTLLTLAVAGALATAGAGQSQHDVAPDRAEPGSMDSIARFTTEPRFLSPWVAYVPDSAAVPSPTRFMGRLAGAPGELARTADIYRYFRALAAATSRVHVESLGRSDEGREILLVAIADEAGIRTLADLKRATAALADPRRTKPADAERIIADARPFYYLNAGLHADESASPETMMELAYRLAVSDQPMIQAIRRNVVVLINPVSNPDGRDKMADWFYRHLKGRTDYDALPRQSPPYWGRYVYVDVNRDGHQQSLPETRAVHRMFYDYHPQVVHDLHEAIPLLQTWNGTGPYNPNLDPIVTSEFLEMSFHEVTTLTAMGMPGVWTWDFGEGFGHHYLESVAMNHNSIGRGYETFGNATAETVTRTIDGASLTREWFRPLPAPRTFAWSMRNSVNYMQTACLAILDYTARHGKDMLRNFYRKGFNSWQKGSTQPPYAFVIPVDQADPGRAAAMINLLRRQQIEVARAGAPFEVSEGRFPAGAYVVRLDQPYRNYAVDLLTPQHFPPNAEHEPYDDVSWALPVHYGVRSVAIADPRIAQVSLEPLVQDVQPAGSVKGSGAAFLLADRGQEALLEARFRLRGFDVDIADRPFTAAGVAYPAGTWIIDARPGLSPALEEVARGLGLDFVGVAARPNVATHPSPVPRVGVWVPWADTDSIGWIRYALDQRHVSYVYLRDEDIRSGGLGERVDVVIYGHVRMDLAGQIHGIGRADGPLPFTGTEQFPSHGKPAASNDITGGIGWEGLAHLQRFVESGGILVTLGNGTALALDGGLVPGVTRARAAGVTTPGAELRASFLQTAHPIAYGYPPDVTVFRSNYPIYDVPVRWREMSYCTSCLEGPPDKRPVVLEWGAPNGEPIVVSGGGKNAGALTGHPAILDTGLGRGRVIAFNFNPIHRDLNRSDFRMLWNVVLNWQHLRAGPASSQARER